MSSKQLWSDEDIARAVYRQSQVDKGGLHTTSVEALMRQVREDIVAAAQKVIDETANTLAEINRQRAELDASHNALLGKQSEQVDRLLAIVDAAQQRITELEAQHIEPDWSQAPGWANWWAKDIDGRKFWYQKEPQTTNGYWQIPSGSYREDGNNLHHDWKQSKRCRPQPQEGGEG